ncbi:MAG: hypothetical protein MI863_15515 [Desulfobacterales bacterium]|nr:hypothetical protein [Desulfobacterales bacterium]
MRVFNVILVTAAFFLGAAPVYADCGKAHGEYNPHKMGRISAINFEDLDTGNDGAVSFEEFKAVFPRTREAGFKMLDKDGDGQLNKAEWDAFKDAHKGMGNYKTAPETT